MSGSLRYTLIKGQFHIFYPDMPRQGPEPDGDTLKFLADDPTLVEGLQRFGYRGPAFNGRQMVNIRFEGIDALETHYQEMHQKMDLAEAARDFMLGKAGFGEVDFWSDLPEKVQSVENHPRPGYVLANGIDIFGRIIAFVYAGSINSKDGKKFMLTSQKMSDSLNAELVRQGQAYPTLYTSLPVDLQQMMKDLTAQAFNAGRGLWPEDTVNPNYWQSVSNLVELQELVMWPKLFRRMARYFSGGFTGLSGFDSWLRADPTDRDDRVQLPDGELGNMHDLLDIDGNWITMKYWPEEIVILPDDA